MLFGFDVLGRRDTVQMQTIFQITGSVYKGATYRIAYDFKAGYSYTIYVTAAAVENTVGNVTGPYFRLDVNNLGGGGSTGCNGAEIITPNTGGNPAAVQLSSNSFQEFQLIFPQLGAQPTLTLTAFPASNGGTKTVRIRKIRIVETPPAVSFTITPAPLSITCGSTTPVPFTLNNGSGTTGITNYTWNLGTTPNGWKLPNGTAAPATYSTGLTNTLTLTPVCGSVQKNISATVTANGNIYNTNTSIVSVTPPNLSISGNSTLCSGSTNYTINGLPCNATIAWAPPPSNLGSLSSLTSSPTTLTYGGSSGTFTLTATVTACGQPVTIYKTITVGPLPLSSYAVSGPATVYASAGYSYSLTYPWNIPTPTNISWQLPTGWTIVNGQGTPFINVWTANNGGAVQVNFTNNCGQNTSRFITVTIGGGGPDPQRPDNGTTFEMFPNPSTGQFTVSLITKSNTSAIKEIIIKNKIGVSIYQQKFNNNQTTQTINLSNQLTDIYTVQVFDGINWSTQKLSLKK